MPMRRMIALTSALSASALGLAVSPASAQVYFRPYGGVYVERYYEPGPGYYAPPPVYGPPPVYAPRAGLPPQDVEPMLRSMGMRAVGRLRADGPTYVVDATDAGGVRQRVRIDISSGQILAMHPIGPAVGSPSGSTSTGRRYAAPPTGGGPVFAAPIPPKRPPELAAVPAPAPIVPDEPAAAPPPSAVPATSTDAPKPADSPQPAAAEKPATEKPAEPASAEAAAQPGAVRVIPGVAVPPGTAPNAAKAGTGTGTGTGTGDTSSAGTASVVVRENPPATLAP
ncbi:hypothetical protein ACO2RV_09930 [Ancylobacter sp. VNQ12]|uniref:hypothetical protein n=1 Tax=Ancylobacter sp. VNQ12 TaxID=3400920 RepID=UPI003C114606